MKKMIISLLAAGILLFAGHDIIGQTYDDSSSTTITASELYSFKMALYVPRIYDNSNSLGSRKYQRQTVAGNMQICYDKNGNLVDVKFCNLINKTHKLSNGKNVTYTTYLDNVMFPRFNAIGSNKTKKFNVASVCFSIAAEPSYNIGEMDEDNGLYLVLAGKGKLTSNGQLKNLSGYAAGTIGCGCKAYGHVSPTRRIGFYGATDQVDDVAAVYGNWSAKFLK